MQGQTASEGYCHGAGDGQGIAAETSLALEHAKYAYTATYAPTIYTPHPEVQATAVQTLNQIAAVVKKKPEKYDPEVHALLQGAALAEGYTTDQMYKAVADREALDRLGRSQNHVRWRDFLSAAVTRWQEYAADFQRQEAEFTQAIENARACISNARERFETCKAALSEDEFQEVAGVTTDDPMGEGARASIGQLDSRRAGCQSDDPEVLCGRYGDRAASFQQKAAAWRWRWWWSSHSRLPGSNAMEPFANRICRLFISPTRCDLHIHLSRARDCAFCATSNCPEMDPFQMF